jgi:hypothetical protein
MANTLRSFELEGRDLDPYTPWDEFLQACAFDIRRTCHINVQASPGQNLSRLVFSRDIINHVRFQENWERIRNNKRKIIEKSNKHKNLNRIKDKYNVGDRILLSNILRKPGLLRKGKYPIVGRTLLCWVVPHRPASIH